MKSRLKNYFKNELSKYRECRQQGKSEEAWGHLERAHILSQNHAWSHIMVHIKMIQYSWSERRYFEVLGQIPRIVLAGPGSILGLAPKGNTGGSNVGIFTPLEIPEELKAMLED